MHVVGSNGNYGGHRFKLFSTFPANLVLPIVQPRSGRVTDVEQFGLVIRQMSKMLASEIPFDTRGILI